MPAAGSEHPNADVRMRGFTQRTTVENALAWVDSTLPEFGELGVEEVSLLSAAGRGEQQEGPSPSEQVIAASSRS